MTNYTTYTSKSTYETYPLWGRILYLFVNYPRKTYNNWRYDALGSKKRFLPRLRWSLLRVTKPIRNWIFLQLFEDLTLELIEDNPVEWDLSDHTYELSDFGESLMMDSCIKSDLEELMQDVYDLDVPDVDDFVKYEDLQCMVLEIIRDNDTEIVDIIRDNSDEIKTDLGIEDDDE